MSSVASEDAAETPQDLLSALAPTLRDASGALIPGAELVVLARALARGFALNPDFCAQVATRCGLPAASVQRTADWLTGLLADARAGTAHTECFGVNCSLQGSERLSAELGALFAHLRVSSKPDRVHCMSQCEDGMSLRSRGVLYLATAHECRTDTRAWRQADSERPVREV